MVSELTTLGGKSASPAASPAPASRVQVKEVRPAQEFANPKGMDVAAGGNNPPQSEVAATAASREEVLEAVNKMQDYMQIIDRDLHFSIDEDSGVTIVKVIDPSTDEVVRQIPSEEVMRVIHSLESGGGLLSGIKA